MTQDAETTIFIVSLDILLRQTHRNYYIRSVFGRYWVQQHLGKSVAPQRFLASNAIYISLENMQYFWKSSYYIMLYVIKKSCSKFDLLHETRSFWDSNRSREQSFNSKNICIEMYRIYVQKQLVLKHLVNYMVFYRKRINLKSLYFCRISSDLYI